MAAVPPPKHPTACGRLGRIPENAGLRSLRPIRLLCLAAGPRWESASQLGYEPESTLPADAPITSPPFLSHELGEAANEQFLQLPAAAHQFIGFPQIHPHVGVGRESGQMAIRVDCDGNRDGSEQVLVRQ